MKDEVKEILENMKEWSVDGNLYFEINDEKAKLLYDYITKLQEIVYNLTTMTANGDRTQIKNTAQYKLELAQQRIDKAIEYCKDITSRAIDTTDTDYDLGQDSVARDILKIIRGEDNE